MCFLSTLTPDWGQSGQIFNVGGVKVDTKTVLIESIFYCLTHVISIKIYIKMKNSALSLSY